MPQLWRSNSTNGTASSPALTRHQSATANGAGRHLTGHHNKGFSALMLCSTPQSQNDASAPFFHAGSGTSPAGAGGAPASPTHPKHYDQLLNELRHAQEKRGRLLGSRAALSENGGNLSPPPLPRPDSKSPPPLSSSTTTTTTTPFLGELRKNLKSPEPPSGSYTNPFHSGCAPFDRLASNGSNGNYRRPTNLSSSATSTPLVTRAGPKRVRFLEDGTGNLHTSVFGGSAESLSSLLDSSSERVQHDQRNGYPEEDIDSLITSLTNFDGRLGPPTAGRKDDQTDGPCWPSLVNGNHQHEQPAVSRVLKSALVNSQSGHQQSGRPNGSFSTDQADSSGDEMSCKVEVVDQRQTVVHLEPDDPNSVDSGSVLSELDFEETSSTITDTYSVINSPDPVINADDSDRNEDLFAEVSDLLERSLQEIRQMEEDSGSSSSSSGVHSKTTSTSSESPDSIASSSATKTGREPLYELIGWKRRNNPPVKLDLVGAKPYPLPEPSTPPTPPTSTTTTTTTDIWVPRQDFVPPTTQQLQQPENKSSKIWPVKRPVLVNNNHPPARKISSSSSGMMMEDNPIYGRLWEAASSTGESSRSSTTSTISGDDLSLVGNSPFPNGSHSSRSQPVQQHHQLVADQELSAIRSMARKARLEHWKLNGVPSGTSPTSPTSPSSGGHFQPEPPPRLSKLNGIQLTWPPPPLPSSSCSSSATATPVTPTLPPLPAVADDHQHQQHSPKCFGHQRTFKWPVPATETGSKVARSSAQSQKSSLMGLKPENLESAQDWYWTEEFPRAAGLEPGTGHMSVWFHGAVSRTEAERRLTDRPVGAFLARLTERLWGYALSVRNPQGGVSHFLIDAGTARSHRKYTLLGSSDPPHKSLRELIQFYAKNPLTPDGQEKLLFPCPQESAVTCPPPPSFAASSR